MCQWCVFVAHPSPFQLHAPVGGCSFTYSLARLLGYWMPLLLLWWFLFFTAALLVLVMALLLQMHSNFRFLEQIMLKDNVGPGSLRGSVVPCLACWLRYILSLALIPVHSYYFCFHSDFDLSFTPDLIPALSFRLSPCYM